MSKTTFDPTDPNSKPPEMTPEMRAHFIQQAMHVLSAPNRRIRLSDYPERDTDEPDLSMVPTSVFQDDPEQMRKAAMDLWNQGAIDDLLLMIGGHDQIEFLAANR